MKDLGDRGVAFMDLGVSMKDMGDRSFAFLDEKFREEAAKHPGAVEMFEEYKDAIEGLVRAVEEFTIGKEGVLEKRGINLNELAQALADQLEEVVNTTVAEFSEPAPEDLDEWCKLKDLDVRVSKILDQVEDAFVAAFATFGLQVPEFEVRASFGHLKPHLKRVVMIVGVLRDNCLVLCHMFNYAQFTARFCCRHPILCSMVALTAMVYVTRGPLIRKVLCLSGFGPLGPIKGEGETLSISSISDTVWMAGSRAAWIQSKWFGAIIPKGSWFSFLQWLAMGYYKGWHC